MEFQHVYAQYQGHLQTIDLLLEQAVLSRNALLLNSSRQLLTAGGKRIRPLFALLCSEFGQAPASEPVQTLAAALELVHMATLVHDDVIDDASLRRGQPTVRAQYGNRPAMYTGDFLFARAIHMLSTLANPQVHAEMSDAMVRMCEGEIDQIRDFFNLQQSLRAYLRRIERKTALLISVSCALGAAVSGAPADCVAALRRFGHHTGMAFQIVDDILDFTGDARLIGKPIGHDLLQGNITLPALYAAQLPTYADRLAAVVHPHMSHEDARQAVELVAESGGIAYARSLATRYLEKAHQALAALPDQPAKEALRTVAAFVTERAY
ncbi:MAG: polyprenyl synthetase family protein [Alicyclobacillus sp.]|nr:polyprenyl synthetase family protein [Alicyclobacillus sp.]